jgi:hypothetical protein
MRKPEEVTADEAVVECLAIVDRCSAASATGRYAEGYRAAAADIRACIEARFGARPVAGWERELRDVEVEARTLSRVIGLLRREQARSSSAAIRRTIGDLITAIDDEEIESSVQLTREVG